jgi:TolB-like protein
MSIRTWIRHGVAFAFLVIFQGHIGFSQDLRAGIDQLAQKTIGTVPEGRVLRVAVVDFPDLQGVTCDLGRYVASRLTTQLSQSQKLFVIERQQLGRILSELKFSMSDLVDPKKAKQLGKMAGAEALIIGSIADMGNQIDVDVRIVEIETNRTLHGTTATISKDPAVQKMQGSGCQGETKASSATPGLATSTNADASQPSVSGSAFNFRTKDFFIKLAAIEREATEVSVDLSITNLTSNAIRGFFNSNGTYLVDDLGNRCRMIGGAGGRNYAPGVAEKCSLKFKGLGSNARFANIILQWYSTGRNSADTVWKNVPLEGR